MTKRRRAFVKLCCGIAVLVFALFGAVGDLTGNAGLWTLGGTVGMARGTIACFILLAIAVLVDTFNGDWPFRELE